MLWMNVKAIDSSSNPKSGQQTSFNSLALQTALTIAERYGRDRSRRMRLYLEMPRMKNPQHSGSPFRFPSVSLSSFLTVFFLAPFLWISFSMWPTSCRYHALSCGLCLFCCNVTEGTHSSLFEATWKCDSFTYETLDWVRIFNSLQLFRCDRSPFYAEWTICSSYELCLIRPWTNIRIKSAASFDNVNCTVVDSQSRHTDSQHCVYAWVLMRCAEKERPLPSPTPND